MVKLSCPDFTFPLMSHNHVLQLVRMLGFKGIDIGLFEGRSHLQPSDQLNHPKRSARLLQRKLDDAGLTMTDLFLDLNGVGYVTNHPYPQRRRKARDLFLKALEYACVCGSKHMTSLPGLAFKCERRNDSFERCADELAWRIEQAQAHRIVFSVEPHIGAIIQTTKQSEKMVAQVPGLTLTMDYGHFIAMGMADSACEQLLAYTSHFHVRGSCKGRVQCSFKENAIDFKRVVKLLRKRDYRGWLCIEYVWDTWKNCNECDTISETILYRDYLRSL